MSGTGFRRHEAVRSLQQAASTIFVLMGLLPFLVFLYLAFILDVMNDLRVLFGLVAALSISILGFVVLLATMRKTSQVLKLLIRTETRAAVSDLAPAIGSIQELRDAADAVGRRWEEDAKLLIGQTVRVGVQNLDEPEIGVLVRTTDDGLVLERDGLELGVLWRFVLSVEPFVRADSGAPTPVTAG